MAKKENAPMKYRVRVGCNYPDPRPDIEKLAALRERTGNPNAKLELRLEEGVEITERDVPARALETMIAAGIVEPWADPESVTAPVVAPSAEPVQ